MLSIVGQTRHIDRLDVEHVLEIFDALHGAKGNLYANAESGLDETRLRDREDTIIKLLTSTL